jgi:HD-like signal output (HDOD) protein
MKNWIARLFGAAARDVAPPAHAPQRQRASDRAPSPPNGEQRRYAEVSLAFFHWLGGPGGQDVPAATETLILDQLERLAREPAEAGELVPRVPAVIPQLLRSLRDESQSGTELARQLGQDVVLVAEVIREANSPWYRPSSPVRTIEGAVMLLGQNGMRMLIARVAFRPIISMQAGRFAKQVAPRIWSQSEKCALAANLLAPGLGADPFEAYLAGLINNVGLVVACRLVDQLCPEHVVPRSDAFCAALLESARALSASIATHWELPGAVCAAIGQAALPDAPPLARALAQGDLLAKLRVMADAGEFAADDPFVVAGLDAAQLRCFDKLRIEED